MHDRDVIQRRPRTGLRPIAGVSDKPIDAIGDAALARIERAQTHAPAAVDLLLVDAMGGGQHPARGDQGATAALLARILRALQVLSGPGAEIRIELRLPRRAVEQRRILLALRLPPAGGGRDQESKGGQAERRMHDNSPRPANALVRSPIPARR